MEEQMVKSYAESLGRIQEIQADIGVGGFMHADRILFEETLGIKFLRLTDERVDAFALGSKLGLPMERLDMENSIIE